MSAGKLLPLLGGLFSCFGVTSFAQVILFGLGVQSLLNTLPNVNYIITNSQKIGVLCLVYQLFQVKRMPHFWVLFAVEDNPGMPRHMHRAGMEIW